MTVSKPKISVKNTLVLLHGDEMAQIAFDAITKQFLQKHLQIKLEEIDLSAENRLRTNGEIVNEAIESLLDFGVGVKNAGITVNKKQLHELLKKLHKEGQEISEQSLEPLATKSPNGAIRKGMGGNIIREDIEFSNLKQVHPDWKKQDLEVETMETGGLKNSFNMIAEKRGKLRIVFTDDIGESTEIHSRPIKKDAVFLFATNDIKKVEIWSRRLFRRALDEKKDVYIGLKDTVIPGYDGVMRQAIDNIFVEKFETAFEKAGIKYHYGLIDAQAANMIVNPPKNAIWGIPDNTSGRKLLKLVGDLKKHGLPSRVFQRSLARMSAGGGDQYGSFNMECQEDGSICVYVGDELLHEREIKKGDPMMLMSNEYDAIWDWVEQCFKHATKKGQEIYFGLKREYMPYDAQYANIVRDVRDKLSQGGKVTPPLMMMRPSTQLRKLIVDPPNNALYAALNLDGDIFSDITAALGGSLATASSIIESPDGTLLFEAPHGTAPDLYEKYLESKGKVALFNPSAILYAFANALETMAERESNRPLKIYAINLKKALIDTVAQGYVTGDIKGRTTQPSKEKLCDMFQFLDKVEENLLKLQEKGE